MSSQLLDPPISARLDDGMISLRSAGMLMTPEEFDEVPREDWDSDFQYELIHGVLVVTPFAGFGETRPNEELSRIVFAYTQTDSGKIVDDTVMEFYLRAPGNRRRVDRVIWTGLGRLPDPYKDLPTIAIEFVADSARDRRRDYIEKREEYSALGIKEYWVIDRFRRSMSVFRGPAEEIVVTAQETYRTDLLPGFELSLSRLLFHADRDRK